MLTNLSCGRFVFYWGIEEGIEVLAKPIFVRAQPFLWKCASHPSMEAMPPTFYGNGTLYARLRREWSNIKSLT